MNKLKRTGHALLALLLAVTASSYFFVGRALASTPGILDTRSIQMSSSAAGATNVKMTFQFNIGTTGNIGGLAIDFCDNDPLPGDTCNVPGAAGGSATFSANKSTIGNPTGQNSLGTTKCGVSDWTLDGTNSTNQHLILTRTASSVTQGCTMSFILGNGTSTGFTLPNVGNYSFYARIFSYATTGGGSGYSSGSPGSYVDFGGIALTTTAQLTITAKVEEQITLCLYTSTCAQNASYAITLGDSNGILSVSHSYSNINAKFDAATNASNGMSVYAYFPNSLKSPQGNTIAAIGSTATSSSPGSEQFGFCAFKSGGSLTVSSPYNNASCNSVTGGMDGTGSAQFAFDGTNLAASGGQVIASSAGPTTTSTATLAFVANIAPTTKAGSYSTTMTLIGVGSY
ncbi:MAG TPA: hypothetical protein VFT49_00050 [Candidatus Saccharimonadales bacterium]|nr:hypothetical protein [Candidatus Saccharimonadales bacterium]